MRDGMRGEERRCEVVRVACLAGMRAQPKGVCVQSGLNDFFAQHMWGSLKPRSCLQLLSEVMLAKR